MKKQIIEIMALAGYEIVRENPTGRLIFWDTETENEVQLWINCKDVLKRCISLIKNRSYDHGRSIGKYETQNTIKGALGL